jgi:hypothetical protein
MNHKQMLQNCDILLLWRWICIKVENNQTFLWNKTIIDFGIGYYLDLSTFKNIYSTRLRLSEYYIFSGW